jgi:hypothetical protein
MSATVKAPPKAGTKGFQLEDIDNLSFGMLRGLYVSYYNGNDQPDCVVPIEDVIAALPTVRRALQQSGSWNRLMDIIR